ncbi:pyrroloquinoline quinone precursor peptide PqqA [Azohydromonas sediminis]|uniref:pyrroloquinoline quinone precursor peptide PqqA n=1 Tax=Azohydromonas sediminis TaxID=2259674 RepID=UPI001B356150
MAAGLCGRGAPRHHVARDRNPRRAVWCGVTTCWRLTMQWQTPQACDFRFGFEITMYVAAR